MSIVFFSISAIYFTLILLFITGFYKVKKTVNINEEPKNSFSICIPFRNEAAHLNDLLHSLNNLNYPKNLYEVILVNDFSTDDYKTVIQQFEHIKTFNLKLLSSQKKTNSPKKEALICAINNASFEWIVATDADCTVPKNWLLVFNQFIEHKNPYFISAPVKFKQEHSFLFHFQNLNFISLIGSSIGSFGIGKPIMCNGANLCYKKTIVSSLNFFEGNENIASGDDVFLLEKIHQNHPLQTHYLKCNEATVITSAEKKLSTFFHQQLRWASKSGSYTNNFSKITALVVFLATVSLVIQLIVSFLNTSYINILLINFVIKFCVDFWLISKTAHFLKSTTSLLYFIPISILYPFFVVIISLLAPFKTFTWKERVFQK